MKPLKLKIKGINSFIEEQEIDFKRLTENKFFGIFGPTGSGKSTILDGITLALYGQVSRKSDNYINANVTSANVSFEFQISGAIDKKYRVEREFKLDKVSKRPRGGKCKVVAIKGNLSEEEVLSEGVKNVNAKCEEIIGLSCDDFTRTVVLPQGKFSDFLTLKGTDRNNMLERLFNLEQYGEQLTSKLKKRGEKEEAANVELQGRLNAYGEVDEAVYKAKKQELDDVGRQVKSIKEACLRADQTFKKSEAIWDLQEELKNYYLEAGEIEKQKPEIDRERNLVETSRKAADVMPFVIEWKTGKKNLRDTEDKLEVCREEFNKVQKAQVDSEVKYEEMRIARDKDLPVLQKKEENAAEALKSYKAAEKIRSELEKITKKRAAIESEITNDNKTIEVILKQLSEKQESFKIKEARKVGLRVDAEYKSKVQEGILAESNFSNLKARKESLAVKAKSKEKVKQTLSSDLIETKKLWKTKQEELAREEEVLINLKNNPPLTEEELRRLYEQKVQYAASWETYNRLITERNESEKIVRDTEGLLQEAIDKEATLKEAYEALEISNLASELRESLKTGEACPVCGSTEHHLERVKGLESQTNKDDDKLLKTKKKEYEQISKSASDLKAKCSMHRNSIEEKKQQISELGTDFRKVDVHQLATVYDEKTKAIENYKTKVLKTENNLKKYQSESESFNTKFIKEKTELAGIENELAEAESEMTDLASQYQRAEKHYRELKADISVESFTKAMEEITEKEREREILEDSSKEISEEMMKLEDKKKITLDTLSGKKESYAILKNDFEHNNKRFHEIWEEITERVGDEKDINGYKEKLSREIQLLADAFQAAVDEKKEAETRFIKIQKLYEHIKGQKTILESNFKERESVMEQKIEAAGFRCARDVEAVVLSDETMAAKSLAVKNFEDKETALKTNIQRAKEKLGEHSISNEQWQEIKENLEQLKTQQKELDKRKIGLEFEVANLHEKLEKIGEISNQKKRIEHTISMLKELEKLFKGKKFVQFVAARRLKYISLAASKTLMEISGGSYELVTNGEGEFIIKDYKNGGVERETSTLSGGELFLASLALALALSNQIQLTNDAPLELFFLDEGFGTLDDNLLEEVITALEKLQSSKRAIGLISHVTEIKNRVPIKLIVTPAGMGKQGSRAHIELS